MSMPRKHKHDCICLSCENDREITKLAKLIVHQLDYAGNMVTARGDRVELVETLLLQRLEGISIAKDSGVDR